MARYGSVEAGGQDAEQSTTFGAKRALVLVATLAAACLAAAVVLIYAGHAGPVSLMEGFTAHLDLDNGALKGLEAAAGIQQPRGFAHGYDDAAPRVPRVLSGALSAEQAGAKSQMLAGFTSHQSRQQMAQEGMASSDYADMTDAAGME